MISTDASIVFDHFSLAKKGPTLALAVSNGTFLSIMGPSGSGKSHFLSCLAGGAKPARGKITVKGKIGIPSQENFGRRDKPQSIAKSSANGASSDEIARILTALGLWECRQQSCANLSPGKQTAARLIAPLLDRSDILLIDHDLDQLDPWTLATAINYLKSRISEGLIVVTTTHRAEIGQLSDMTVVFNNEELLFAGTPIQLVRSYSTSEIEVWTDDQVAARAIVEPFEVSVRVETDRIVYTSSEGQSLAAKLLLEGYGDVKYIVERPSSFEEALKRVVSKIP